MSATTIVKRFFFISVRFKAILVTLLACVLSTGAVLAQSKPDNSNDNEPARVEIPPAPRETNNRPATNSQPDSSGRVFKPSEEISEDLPVPFPVDI